MLPSRLSAALVTLVLIVGACAAGNDPASSAGPATTAPDPATIAPGSSTQPSAPGAPSGSTEPSAGPATGQAVDVTVGTDAGEELRFDPATVTVAAGSQVRLTFENRATVPHNLTLGDPIGAATATVVAPGTSETLEFGAPDPGDYAFACTLHPGMSGTLTVEAR